MKIKSQSQSGFTLVEALVAITILLIGVVGPLTIAARGISDGLYARNLIAANYLAQEAVELVVWNRNINVSNPNIVQHWSTGLKDKTCRDSNNNNSVCLIAADGAITDSASCNGTGLTACDLVFDAAANKYVSADPLPAQVIGPIFRRELYLVPVGDIADETLPAGSELQAVVKISWKNKTVGQSVTLTERLYPRI